MFFPAVVSDPKRRSKVVADRVFCVVCLLVCTSGPALMTLGTLLFTAVDDRSANMEAYNAAVGTWNSEGGGLQRFSAASFVVTVRPRGFTRNMTSNVLEPFSENIDVSADMSGASAGLLRTVDEDILPHFPYHFRSTTALLGRAFWSSSLAIPEWTFEVAAEYRTPTSRRSAFSLNVPVFQKVDEIMTSDACELRHGIWLGGSKYEGPCSLVGRLESVCVRVRLAVDFTWTLDNVDEDGAPDQGCWSRDGKMTSFIYTPLVKADTSVSLGGVSFLVRSTDDPYIKAQRLTDGSMYFGKNLSDQVWLGVSFWILGLVAFAPCCIFICVLKRAAGQKRKQRVLGGHLEEVGEQETGRDEEAAGVGKGAGRVNEMRRRGGAFKHGDDAGLGAGSHELPPLRSSAGMKTGGGKTQQAGPASPGEEEGGGLSSKAMLTFASDLGIEPADVTEYMWLCEEALSKDVLKNWEAHSDSKGDVYFFDTETETSKWEHPLAEYYHNYYLSLKAKNMSVRVVGENGDSSGADGSLGPRPGQASVSRRPERGPSGRVERGPPDVGSPVPLPGSGTGGLGVIDEGEEEPPSPSPSSGESTPGPPPGGRSRPRRMP